MKSIIVATLGAAALMLAALPTSAQPAASRSVSTAERCAGLARLTLPGSDLQISKAEAVPPAAAGTLKVSPFAPPLSVAMPAYCRIEGSFERRTGAGGKPYAIGFALALPDDWNGRFLFQGGGGLNGTIGQPVGYQAAGDTPALARGFAVVSTDSGHRGAVFDASFMQDQMAALNFAQGSVGKVTRVAKQIVATYYGRPARYSYFDGCSTGGREGMLAAERYPDEFDGVVAGDPAMETGYSGLGLTWAAVAFNRAAPKDASGNPVPAQLFSKADKQLLISRLLEECDGLDGRKDGLIFDFAACRFDPAVLTCASAKSDACLTAGQVGALKSAFAGPRTAGGVQLYPPFPFDTGVASEQGIGGLIPSSAPSPLGPPNRALQVDLDQAAARLRADGVQGLVDTANWTNLSAFFGHGGKILFYHGLSDPWFSPLETLAYYQSLAAANGGAEAVRGSSRIFLVPGMAHCQGGPVTLDQFDLLSAVVDWTEHGKAPDQVVATGASLPGQSRPLCAWPAHAQYSGSGDPSRAASYLCRE
ncbi:MAG TPA: tannase/feruloyl esterase family alpha/beta hydrolase [Caulobacteraceae bacterium]